MPTVDDSDLSLTLARHAVGVTYADLPARAVSAAKASLLDAIGVERWLTNLASSDIPRVSSPEMVEMMCVLEMQRRRL